MPNQYVNKVTKSDGTVLIDITDTTAAASDVNSGKYIYLADGSRVQGSQTVHTVSETLTHVTSTNQATKIISGDSFHAVLTPDSGYRIESITVTMGGVDITSQVFSPGTGAKAITANGTYDASDDLLGGYSQVMVNVPGGGGSATAHTIYLELGDGTDATIPVYYDDAFIGAIITASAPTTYGWKTVTLAQLDGVTWYEPVNIPLNTQLIDFTNVTNDYVINASGEAVAEQWYSCSDFTLIDPSMTFDYKGCRWFYLAFYDSSKTPISSIYMYNDTTEDPNNSNIGNGTLSGSEIPLNARYVRISSTGYPDASELSLIRTA